MAVPFTPFNPPDLSGGGVDLGSVIGAIGALRAQRLNQDLTANINAQNIEEAGNDYALQRAAKLRSLGLGPEKPNFDYQNATPSKVDLAQPRGLAGVESLLTHPNFNAAMQKQVLGQQALQQKGELGQEALDLKKNQLDEKSSTDTAKTNIAADRASVYKFKNENPNSVIKQGGDGHLYAINPQTNAMTDLGQDGTSDADKLQLGIQGKLAVTAAEGSNQIADINARGEQTRQTDSQKVPSGQSTTATLIARAHEALNTHPEWASFINILDANNFHVQSPGGGGMFSHAGPTPEQYKQINDFIYKGTGSSLGNKNTTQTTQTQSKTDTSTTTPNSKTITPDPNAPKAPTGRVNIFDSKTGKLVGSVPQNQAGQAKTQGFIVPGGTDDNNDEEED